MPDHMNCGIYTITAPSGHQYVGSACNIRKRWVSHLKKMNDGTHHNRILINAHRKYGNALRFDTIIICEKHDLIMYEQIAINALKPRYNLSPTAGSNLGIKFTQETREKVSAAVKRRFACEGARLKATAASKAWFLSKSNREKHSAAMRGHACSEEARAKIGAAHRERFRSQEPRDALRALYKGKPLPKETCLKMSASKKNGKWITNGSSEKYVRQEDALPNGWVYGRKMGLTRKKKSNHPLISEVEKFVTR